MAPPKALSSESITSYIAKSIPSAEGKQALKDAFAAISVHAHACMLAVGFKLVGLGEDHRIEAHSESTDTQPLPQEWDQHSSYAFRYTHPQSSMDFLLKVTRLGGKAIIFGVGLPDDKTAQVEVKAQDYVSENSLKDSSVENIESLKDCYISAGRVEDLADVFKSGILQKLIPGVSKEGYEETAARVEARDQLREEREGSDRQPARNPLRDDRPDPARPHPFNDPLADSPRRPRPVPDFLPPGFEDEHELQRPGGRFPGMQPFGNIGERDLYPPGLGPHDPLRIGPGGGYRGGGGMHPTFDDPLFQGQGGQGGGYDPRAPPGARYDPVGPGDGPPNLRGGRGFPGGGGGMPRNPFGGFGGGDFI